MPNKPEQDTLLMPIQNQVNSFLRWLQTHPSRIGTQRGKRTIETYAFIINKYVSYVVHTLGKRDFKEVTTDEVERFVIELPFHKKKNGDVSWYYRNLTISVLCLLYKFLYRENAENHPCVRRLRQLIVRPRPSERIAVKREDLLTEEDLLKLLRACDYARTQLEAKRNRALIAVLYESGCRISELLNLNIGDVELTDYGFRLHVEGKTGRRVVPIINAAIYLREWLTVHPKFDDESAPLFITFEHGHWGQRLTYFGARDIIKRTAKIAGIKKRIRLHLFRHTRATDVAPLVKEAVMRELFGWSKSSPMPSVYTHLSGADVEENLLRAYGLRPEKDIKPLIEERKCPRCGESNEPHELYCEKCGAPLMTGVQVISELSDAKMVNEEMKQLKEQMKKLETFLHRILPNLTEEDLELLRRRQEERELHEMREAELEYVQWQEQMLTELKRRKQHHG
ncbi:MAG: tyrosine-type recombinase/integrase [Candidatus Baldrarchaeia archaeon]